MAAQPAPNVSRMEAMQEFLFSEFPSKATFTTTNYQKDAEQTTPEALEKRLKGYQHICEFGLGSVFWGAAAGVLENLQSTKPNWVHWATVCFAVSLMVILTGLAAATFQPPKSSLALGTAGLGAWTAYVYMIATFHVASLKFHAHVTACIYSMVSCTVAMTFLWGYISQDPIMFLVISKFVVWLLVLLAYGICGFIHLLLWFIVQTISALRSLGSSIWKKTLLGCSRCSNVKSTSRSPLLL